MTSATSENGVPHDELTLATPTRFDAFPYEKPYDIQLQLMRHLYEAIESRSLAIIESPTGTGKTLSLLTAALTWLRDDRERARKGQLAELTRSLKEKSGTTEPEWVIEQSVARHKRLLDHEEEEFAERLVNVRKREEIIRRKEKGRVVKKARGERVESTRPGPENEEERFLPEDGHNKEDEDDEDLLANMSPLVREQIRKLKGNKASKLSNPEPEDPTCTKIFFASRTHTQLTQAISELRRIKFAPTLSTANVSPSFPGNATGKDDSIDLHHVPQTRAVPLGSRKNLCINDDLVASLRRDKKPPRGKEQPLAAGRAQGKDNSARDVGDLDEACRELNNRPKESRCPFLPGVDEESRLLDFRDHTLASPRDIEDLVALGRELKTCPYYGSRKAVNRAELVTLPYNLLLHKTAREALGIDLKNHVVIVDEAHNLIDTVLSIHSCTLTSTLLQLSLAQLKAYYDRFRTRLSPKHALHLKRLVLFISALADFCRSFASGSLPPSQSTGRHINEATTPSFSAVPAMAKSSDGSGSRPVPNSAANAPHGKPSLAASAVMMTVGELVSHLGAKIDGFNLLEVVQYLRESKLARKITGYCDYVLLRQLTGEASRPELHSPKERRTQSPPLHAVEAFLLILVDPNDYGRIFVEKSTPAATPSAHGTVTGTPTHGNDRSVVQTVVTLKYQLLNPEEAFRDVVQDARAVILAGGTMTPMSDFSSQLFSYLPEEGIKAFSCGHVIPVNNLQTLVLTQGPRKTDLVWKFDQRGNKEMIEELGQMILNIATVVPFGLVVFFPSYAFLDQARLVWQTGGTIEKRLGVRKKVFFEPREGSDIEAMLREYAEAARRIDASSTHAVVGASFRALNGAILFAVVGGKVSEGLNFTDELARAVVVIGLPFANLGSQELQERMRFVKERAAAAAGSAPRSGKDAGVELYENMCMKAVNQSIGRAIRHQNDWASLILIDQRYSTPRIQYKLPHWIRGTLSVPKTWGDGLRKLGGFYAARRPTNER